MSKIEEMAEKEYPIENVGFQCKIAIGSVPEAMDSNEGYRNAYVAGANDVLDIIEQALTPQKCLTDIGIDVSPEALVKTALQTIEELKK